MSALANALIAVALAALLSAVQSQPSPGVATAGSSANSGAFSSSGTSLRPGPGGTGSFVAQSGFSQDSSSPYYRTAVSSSSPQGFASGYAGGYSSGGGYSTGGGISTGGGYSTGGGFPFPSFAPFPYTFFAPAQPFDFTSFFQNYISSIQRYHQQIAEAAKKAAAEHNQGGLAPQFPQSPDSFGNELGGPVGAAAFGQYGPQGGYGGAGVFPAPDNSVYNRFGGPLAGSGGPVAESSGPFPPPGGSFYGVSSFSSSGQSDVNGKKTSYKQSAVTVNDNGKVTTYQAHDP